MGLFGSPPAVDPKLEAHLISSKDDDRRATLKGIAKNQAGIYAMLESGESLLAITYFMGDFGGDNLVVITDRRTVTMKKGSTKQELRHEEVVRTTIAHMPNGSLLVDIFSKTSELDYGPDDPERFAHIIQFQVSTPRIAQTLCATIDQFL